MASRIQNKHSPLSSRLLPTLFISVVLAGCVTQTEINQPAPALPEQYSTAGKAVQQQQWWRSFSDQQLNTLINEALSSNFDLKATVARVRQAEALAKKSGASTMPSLEAIGEGSKSYQSGPDSESLQLGLKASYEIDLWSRLQAAEDGVHLDYLASREALEVAALTLSANVADRWYALAAQEELIQLYQQQLKTLNDQLTIIELRFNNGQLDSEDTLQQHQQIESLNSRLSVAQYERQIIEQQLAVLLGQSQLTNIQLPDQLPVLASIPDAGLPGDLAARRPDLKQAWLQLQSAQKGLVVAEADRLPQIRLSASLLSSSQSFSSVLDNWATNLAANLTAPLIDGGYLKAEVERQQAVVDESVHLYSQQVLTAFSDIETALLNETSQQEQLDSINLQLSLARQTETIKWSRYQNGAVNFLEVLTAQQSRLDLEQQQIQSHSQLLSNRITLHRAIAGDLNYAERVSLNMTNKEQSAGELK